MLKTYGHVQESSQLVTLTPRQAGPKEGPDSPPHWRATHQCALLAKLARAARRHGLITTWLGRAHQSGPQVCVLLGCWLLLAGDTYAHASIDKRLLELNAQIANSPTDHALYVTRARVHRSHEDWKSAFADLTRAKSLAPNSLAAHLEYGRTWLRAGKLKAAEQSLRAFVRSHTSHAEGHLALGETMRQLGRIEEARRLYTIAIDKHARPSAEMYLTRANLDQQISPDNVSLALSGLDDGIARTGSVALSLAAIELASEAGDTNEALRRLAALIASTKSARRGTSATQAQWHLRRAKILERGGRNSEAISAYKSALRDIHRLPHSRQSTRLWQGKRERVQAALARLEAL